MDKNNVKVSVMVLAYNHGKYIREALESMVTQQTNFKYEIVIGEDCSTDDTRQIIMEYYKKYPGLIVPLLRKKNLGATRNLASTLRHCSGEYVAFMECDDFWIDSLKLQKQADFLDAHADYSGVFCDTLVVSRYSKPIVTVPAPLKHEIATPLDYVKTMYPQNEFKFCGALMIRNYFENGKNDKYLTKTDYVDDVIVQAISLRNGKIGFMKECMAAYRWVPSHGGNFSALKADYISKDKIKAYRILRALFPQNTYFRLYMRICREHHTLIDMYVRKKEYYKAIKYYVEEVKNCEKILFIYYWIKREITGVE